MRYTQYEFIVLNG